MNDFQLMMEQAMLSCCADEKERFALNPALFSKIRKTVPNETVFQPYSLSEKFLREDVPSSSLSIEALFCNVPARISDWVVTPEAISEEEEEA